MTSLYQQRLESFLASMRADHNDEVTRAVFADWLEDREDPRSKWVRTAPDGERAALLFDPFVVDFRRPGAGKTILKARIGVYPLPVRKSVIRLVATNGPVRLTHLKVQCNCHEPVILRFGSDQNVVMLSQGQTFVIAGETVIKRQLSLSFVSHGLWADGPSEFFFAVRDA